MARPTFDPNEEQDATLKALAALAAERARIEEETDVLIIKADQQKIPISHIADTAKRQRKTIYRHLGKPMK